MALGIAEARQAEIDGQNPRSFELLRGLDQILPGAAAGNQDVDLVGSTQPGMRFEPVAEILLHGLGLPDRGRLHPSWIRVLLVLLLDLERHVVGDGGEVRNETAREPLVERLADLLGQQRGDRRRPGSVGERLHARQGMERQIARNCDQPKHGNGAPGSDGAHEPLAHPLQAFELLRCCVEDVFVDEALSCQRAEEAQQAIFGGRSRPLPGRIEQDGADSGETPLELDIADRDGFQEQAQQLIVGDRSKAAGQILEREPNGPLARRPGAAFR